MKKFDFEKIMDTGVNALAVIILAPIFLVVGIPICIVIFTLGYIVRLFGRDEGKCNEL